MRKGERPLVCAPLPTSCRYLIALCSEEVSEDVQTRMIAIQENEVQLVFSLMNELGVTVEEQHYQHIPLRDMVGESLLD